ncbi:DUF1302 domain-containing protein [Janthinobacterium tructae]|uniref:DUF1302 domain-containing protein n=1 Tax=Janthinobacterium tructae TaxID=2590869 RepID=UPI00249B3A97|nr:DUF1302 family protein [Janthinobacterium tructae]MDI3292326.1 DUF1302 family protein [Janthinobacterium tructae]
MAVTAIFSSGAIAFEIESNSDAKVRWDNTLKYTAAWRTGNADLNLANQNGQDPNADFGDLNFKSGLINNRVDLLSELDFKFKNLGFRISGAAWNDAQYTKGTGSFPAAPFSPPNYQSAFPASLGGGENNRYARSARKTMGQSSEWLDAFVYGKFEIGERNLSVRVGKHSLIYGESLYLGANGIAAAQGPVDVVKALSLPSVQFKEIARPVKQISVDLSLGNGVTIGGYTQFEWKAQRIPAAGSYFSAVDILGDGGDLLLHSLGCQPAMPTNSAACALPGYPFSNSTGLATRGQDFNGSDSGQFGLRLTFNAGDVDYGLYAAKYDDKSPIPVLNIASIAAGGGVLGGGTYNLMYAKNISIYGASFSTVWGGSNIAGEISTRRNTPLAIPGDLIINSAIANADNDKNTPYARGNSLHLNLSVSTLFSGNGIWGGASLTGELAYNHLLKVTHRPVYAPDSPNPLNSTHSDSATAIRMVFQPDFFQVLPNVDLQVPIGIGYGLSGRSAVVMLAPEKGGDINIGFNATINRSWRAGLSFAHYFGSSGGAASPVSDPKTSTYASYKQYYGDRDFIALTLQTTF